MQRNVISVGPLVAASANNIALSQTPSTGALTLNGSTVTGGVAVLDKPRQVLITTAGNESAKTFTITGTDWAGNPISETVTGPNISTAASVLNYATVTSITISAGAAAALTVGTNGVASSPWLRLDEWANPVVSKQCNVTGTVNYTVQFSMDDPNSYVNSVAPSAMTWINDQDLDFVDNTVSAQGFSSFSPTWIRIVLNSGTGSVMGTFAQMSVVPY